MPALDLARRLPENPAGSPFRLRDVPIAIRRNGWLVLTVTAISMAGAAFATSRMDPVYTSEASLLVQDEGPGLSLLGGLAALNGAAGIGGAAGGGSAIRRDAVILGSRTMIEALVDSLGLQVQLVDPGLRRTDVFSAVAADRSAPVADYTLVLVDGEYSIRRIDEDAAPVEIGRAAVGGPVSLPGVRINLNPLLISSPPREIALSVVPFAAAVGQTRAGLLITQPDQQVSLLVLNFRTNRPDLAALVPNALAALYVSRQSQDERSSSADYAEFLRQQANIYDRDLREAEAAVQVFQETSGLISPQDQAAGEVTYLIDLKVQRDELQVQYESLASLLAAARSTADRDASPEAYRQLATHPTFIEDPSAEQTLTSLFELEGQRENLLVRRTEANVDVAALTRRITELETKLRDLAQNHLRSLTVRMSTLDQALARFDTQVGAIPAQTIELARLQRQQKLLEQISLLVQTKLKEKEMEQASDSEGARLLDPAQEPGGPVSPQPMMNLMIAAVAGLLLGVTLAIGRRYLDGTVRSRQDLEPLAAGAPVIGLIPATQHGLPLAPGGPSGWRSLRIRIPGPQGSSRTPEPLLSEMAQDDPRVEAYRSLRTGILMMARQDDLHALLITSSVPGEGKTLTALNLGLALAQQGTRTLVVDADLRRGAVHRSLQVGAEPGLSDLIGGTASLEEVVRQVAPGRFGVPLDVIPCGTLPPNPTELLGSPEMRSFVESVRDRYDIAIFDTPPLNAVADAAVLASMTDAVVMVARVGRTQQPDLWAAAVQLQRINSRVLGVVLTGTDGAERPYSYTSLPSSVA